MQPKKKRAIPVLENQSLETAEYLAQPFADAVSLFETTENFDEGLILTFELKTRIANRSISLQPGQGLARLVLASPAGGGLTRLVFYNPTGGGCGQRLAWSMPRSAVRFNKTLCFRATEY